MSRSSKQGRIRCGTLCQKKRKRLLFMSRNLEAKSNSRTHWTELSESFGGGKVVIICPLFNFWTKKKTTKTRTKCFVKIIAYSNVSLKVQEQGRNKTHKKTTPHLLHMYLVQSNVSCNRYSVRRLPICFHPYTFHRCTPLLFTDLSLHASILDRKLCAVVSVLQSAAALSRVGWSKNKMVAPCTQDKL